MYMDPSGELDVITFLSALFPFNTFLTSFYVFCRKWLCGILHSCDHVS